MDAKSKKSAGLERCEEILGYRFNNLKLLKQALTHSSCAQTHIDSNERLEFLGDAILGFIISDMLYQTFPNRAEGELSQMKSVVVSRETCRKLAQQMGLDQFLITGKGLQLVTNALVANLMEAIIGAIYLDGGYDCARRFVLEVFQTEIPAAIDANDKTPVPKENERQTKAQKDAKTKLQEFAQSSPYNTTPIYKVVSEEGPPHDRRFQAVACIGSELFPPAWGKTKKSAEQAAALNALNELASR